MEGYLRAASKVTALAVGDPDAESSEAHYRVPKTASQLRRVDGAPLGTRGGIAVTHTFPADGDYVFRIELHGNADGFLFGGPASGEQIDVSINGERKALLDVDPNMAEVTTSLFLKTPPIHVAAGPQRIAAAFIQRFEGPVNDLVAPIDHTLADTQIGVAYGVTTLPHLKDLAILGPQHVTGVSADAEPRSHLRLPSDDGGRRGGVRDQDRHAARGAGVPPPGEQARHRVADALLRRRPQGARLRERHRRGARGDPREPAVRLPRRVRLRVHIRSAKASPRRGSGQAAERRSLA